LKIDGRMAYLWRAVDAEGEVLDVLVQAKRNKRAALKLMRKLLKRYGFVPDELITDDLRSYAAAARHLGIAKTPRARSMAPQPSAVIDVIVSPVARRPLKSNPKTLASNVLASIGLKSTVARAISQPTANARDALQYRVLNDGKMLIIPTLAARCCAGRRSRASWPKCPGCRPVNSQWLADAKGAAQPRSESAPTRSQEN
jgi:hypothetical protein